MGLGLLDFWVTACRGGGAGETLGALAAQPRPDGRARATVTRGGGELYVGDEGVWAPQEESGFLRIPDRLLPHFEEQILRPYFDLAMTEFAVRV